MVDVDGSGRGYDPRIHEGRVQTRTELRVSFTPTTVVHRFDTLRESTVGPRDDQDGPVFGSSTSGRDFSLKE